MTSTDLTLLGITVLLIVVLVLAIVEVAFHHLNKISIRAYREERWKTEFLSQRLDEPMSFVLPLRIGIQGALIAVAVLVTDFFIDAGLPWALVSAFLTIKKIILIPTTLNERV